MSLTSIFRALHSQNLGSYDVIRIKNRWWEKWHLLFCTIYEQEVKMGFRVVIDGNAFYEIDEDCLKQKEQREALEREEREGRTDGEIRKTTKKEGTMRKTKR